MTRCWGCGGEPAVTLFLVATAAKLGFARLIGLIRGIEMQRIMRRVGLRSVAAAVLALAVTLCAAATPGVAASYTLNFTGTVTGATGVFPVLGTAVGDAVSGSMTFDPLGNTPVPVMAGTLFDQTASSFTFHTEHSSIFDFTRTDTGDGLIQSSDLSLPGLILTANGAVSNLFLTFRTDGSGYTALTSLSGLPTTPNGIIAMLTGSLLEASGTYALPGHGSIDFDVTVAAVVTPVPAALPLFASGVLVLGYLARKRRKDAAA
jgi:hypothetical protein